MSESAGAVDAVGGGGPAGGDPDRAYAPVLLLIEKGEPSPLEIGVITAVLFQRLTALSPPETAGPAGEGQARPAARWRRPERSQGFAGPRTWQNSPSTPS
ncbi:acyl-CoA carboxylase subunit epsilon [Streptomyces chartreusis]|uniref:acyl-CoA carboxylase subunit epsilon n=1 Tax=Streptomyces chartreusis TaxID=1969 RepID=UPI00386346AC|nr:hypothetical protein OG938_47395 [Streptomyces chartreusis]WTA33669.1 hypothetical protein OIA45_47975 [Streptomyces chartreusis]